MPQDKDEHDDWTDAASTVMSLPWSVRFHDDPETPVDFVLHLLEKYFGYSEPDARAMAAELSAKGSVVAGRAMEPIMKARFEKLQAAVQEAGFPFRMTLEPPPEEPDI